MVLPYVDQASLKFAKTLKWVYNYDLIMLVRKISWHIWQKQTDAK